MSATYVPPIGSAVGVTLRPGYTPPLGDRVNVTLGETPSDIAAAVYVTIAARFGVARRRSAAADSRWQAGAGKLPAVAGLCWSRGARSSATRAAAWRRVVASDAANRAGFGAALVLASMRITSPWLPVYRRDARAASAWARAHSMWRQRLHAPWVFVRATDRRQQAAWSRGRPPALIYRFPPASPYVPPLADAVDATLVAGYVPPPPLAIVVTLLGPTRRPDVLVIRADHSGGALVWGRSTLRDERNTIRWGRGPQYRRPDPPPTDSGWTGSPNEPPPIPLASRVYIVMNNVSVVRLPDGTPIDVVAVDLNASVDAWCWSVRMELADPTQMALLKPDGNGPKLVQITMNGYVWTAIVEGRESSRAHADESITVTGRSQTALLSNAYITARSAAFVDPQSAQQLALREITDRALPFTLQWSGLDWVVPGGAWYYQDMTPIDVIAQIAASRGAVLQSAPADAQLIVQSRYPVSPWAWSAGAADVALPSAWMADVSAQQQSKPLYDAVVIAGQAQGVLARITRAGQAGETFASQVVDQLIVTPDVAVERGRNILSDRGVQELMTCNVPLFPTGTITAGMSGLYAPLLLVDVQDPADPYQAQSVGVTVSARRAGNDNKALEIWQRIELERHLTDAH